MENEIETNIDNVREMIKNEICFVIQGVFIIHLFRKGYELPPSDFPKNGENKSLIGIVQ